MLKKIARDFFIVFGLVVLWASTSREAMEFISTKRRGNDWWSVYKANGNLLQLSHLDFVKAFNDDKHAVAKSYVPNDEAANTVLNLYGDSYSWSLNDSDFTGLSSFRFINLYTGGKYFIDTTKKNVLILEIAELSFRSFFADTGLITKLQYSETVKKTARQVIRRECSQSSLASFNINLDAFFNSRINQNLEYNLFNYKSTYYLFLCKAALNYYLFNRASGDVVISKKGDYLILKDALKITGASIPPGELTTLVDNINRFYDHFRQAGFNEVYLSVIPGTSTIIQPEGYNQIIPMVQQDTRLRIKIIDAYSAFKDQQQDYFCHGDTHWNKKGKKKWLNMVDEIIRDWNKK
jgi:hypothetical protein